jgi:hypothetical protein
LKASERHISQLIVVVTGGNMWSKDTIRGCVDGIRFENIEVTAWTTPEVYLAGLDAEHMVQDITIENLRVNGRRVTGTDGIRITIKPFVKGLSVEVE